MKMHSRLSYPIYIVISKSLLKNLDVAVSTSNNIHIQVDQKLATINDDISAKESEIARIDGEIRDINAKIQAKRNQINAAEQSVSQAERLVADAQNGLRRAEQEVEDVKLCVGLIGRQKRFLSNV